MIIGIEMDQQALTNLLNGCLLTDAEMKLLPEGWSRLPDPFPTWQMSPAKDDALAIAE